MKTTNRILVMVLFLAAAVQAKAVVVSLYDLQGTAGFGLLPGNEPGSVSGGTGGEIGAGIFLDDGDDADPNTNLLTLNVGWGSSQGFTDLSSTATSSHIHGPTATANGNGFTQTAGVFLALTRSSSLVTGGVFTNGPINLTAADVANLDAGKFYINIHTSNNGGGELRGFLVGVPEPSRTLLSFVGVALIGLRRRRS